MLLSMSLSVILLDKSPAARGSLCWFVVWFVVWFVGWFVVWFVVLFAAETRARAADGSWVLGLDG